MITEAPTLKDGNGRELCRLHDTVQQHIRALKALGHEPPGPFVTSVVLELKLDQTTTFEWQKHSTSSTEVPHYQDLLEFVNLRAQASESSAAEGGSKKVPRFETRHPKRDLPPNKAFSSFTAAADLVSAHCILCKSEKHPLYSCAKFKALSHDQKLSTLRDNNLCLNCLGSNHFVKECKSAHRCRRCQRPYHTLLHAEAKEKPPLPLPENGANPVNLHSATPLKCDSLLMTCRVLVGGPDGSMYEARAILDSASMASFLSERLAQTLRLCRSSQNPRISGIAGLSDKSSVQAVANFSIASRRTPSKKFNVTTVIVPQVTCDLPHHPIELDHKWEHLADPGFGQPGAIDILLGVDVFVQVLLQGHRFGPPDSPVSLETELGWVLAGGSTSRRLDDKIATHHASLDTGDDILQRFWELEEDPLHKPFWTS